MKGVQKARGHAACDWGQKEDVEEDTCTMTYPQDNQANPHNQLKSKLPSKMTTCATLTRQDSEAHQANEQLKTKLPPDTRTAVGSDHHRHELGAMD